MTDNGVSRRLAAIVVIDVAGYSRLMGADEAGTLTRLKNHRDATDPLFARHGGRIVGSAGDGLLLEFPSVVEAVTCAIAVQALMASRNADLPDDEKMLFRIGINLGDVLVDGDDIYGDGVNVAARIEALAEPGGICVSRTVRDNVRDRMAVGLEDLGEIDVKNIARPVRVFRVLADSTGASAPRRRLTLRHSLGAAIVALALAMAGGLWWWQPWLDRAMPGDSDPAARELPDKPSIAVLPFENSSGNAANAALVAGFSNDIGAALSKLSELFVVTGGATRSFSKNSASANQISQALGVRYILRGSVERGESVLRIQALLMDGRSGATVWSERYERAPNDLFAIRDEVTLNVVSEVGASISQGERDRILRRGTDNLEAWLLVREALYRISLLSPEHVRPAEEMAKRAIALDPNYADAYGALSGVYRQQGQNWPGDKSRKELFALSEELVRKALALDPESGSSHMRLATIHLARAEHDEAVASASKAVALMPNNWVNQGVMGWVLNHAGEPRKALSHLKLAMRLNPNHPHWALREVAHSHMLMGQDSEALAWHERTIARKPDRVTEMLARLRSAIILHGRGDVDDARDHVARALEVFPRTSLAFLHRSRPYRDPAIYARWDPILRALGVPERGPDDK